MLPTINGKSFLNCSIDDLKGILDNQDYRESDCLDYKKSFEIIEIPKCEKDAINKAKAEFRKDVCAFANAQGGYIIYGIKEDGKAIPHELFGIEIDNNNTEAFENTVKNALQTISPRIPHFEINYIKNSHNYIVVLYIHHDYFAPYVFLENNQDYRVYKRVGSSAKVLTYLEMKSMFTQSLSLEREIDRFRHERINYFLTQEEDDANSQFLLFHIIPDTFLDSSYNTPLFVHQLKGVRFSQLFYHFECCTRPFPIPEGLRFSGNGVKAECRLYNSGIAEFFYPLKSNMVIYSDGSNEFFDYSNLWYKISESIRLYVSSLKSFVNLNRIFSGISLVGCKNIVTEYSGVLGGKSCIDRNNLLCAPIGLIIDEKNEIDEKELSLLHLEFLTSIGIRFDKDLREIIKKVYGE